ncbi:MAG: caspase family protein [Kiloniellales bacterium]
MDDDLRERLPADGDAPDQAFDDAEGDRQDQADRPAASGPGRLVLDRARVPPVRGSALGGLGNVLGMVLGDGTAPLWNLSAGREVLRLRDPDGGIRSLALSPDGGTVATGGRDGVARFWNTATGTPAGSLASDGGPIEAALFSPSGRTLLLGGADGVVRLYDRAAGEEIRRFAAHQGAVTRLTLDADGRLLGTAGADGQVRLWTVGPGPLAAAAEVKPLALLGGAAQVPGMAIAFSPDRRHMAIGAADGSVTLFDVAAGAPVHRFTEHRGPVTAVAFGPDGAELASGGRDRVVNLYSIDRRALIRRFEGHADAVTAVSFEPSGRMLTSSSLDGTSRIWRRATGEEAARLVSAEDGWLVTDPAGRFDGSRQALDSATIQSGDRHYRLEQFAESHYQPDLLALIVAEEADPPATRLADGISPPPAVEIFWDEARYQDAKEEELELKVAVENQGGGIDEIRLYHNRKLVVGAGATRTVPTEEKQQDLILRDFRVELLPGDNQLRVVALSTGRVESEPKEISVRYDGPQRDSTLHVVAVGINEYKNPDYRLNYGVTDAEAILGFFDDGRHQRRLYKSVKARRLSDKKATKRAIVRRLEALSKAAPQDTVVLYLAGHGDTFDGEWFFWGYDLVRPERESERRDKGLSRTELLDLVAGVGAQKILMLIDSCKSGSALNTRGVAADRKALSQLARAAGIHLVAAAGQEQFATELKELGHGVFTYAVLEGLNGQADGAPGDGIVSIYELLGYIDERIPEVSRRYRAKPQYPVVDSRGLNFPIAVVQ